MREGRRLGSVGTGCIMCLCVGRRHSQKLACPRDVLGATAIGEQAIVADAVEAAGQDVDQEPADELVCRQRHLLEPIASLDSVIPPLERDALIVKRDEAAVGDGDVVRVIR